MKKLLFLSLANLLCLDHLLANNIIYREEQYYYPPPPPPYYYTFPYQPDNGPMRGPNSLEGHKSYEERLRPFDY